MEIRNGSKELLVKKSKIIYIFQHCYSRLVGQRPGPGENPEEKAIGRTTLWHQISVRVLMDMLRFATFGGTGVLVYRMFILMVII